MAGDYCERFTEEWELVDFLRAANVNANVETNSGWNDMGGYHRICVVIIPNSLNDALDVDIEQATDSSGTGIKTVDSNTKDITVATADTNPSAIEIQMEEMDVTNRFNHLQVEITTANTGGNSNYFDMLIFGLRRYGAAATTNWDSVTD